MRLAATGNCDSQSDKPELKVWKFDVEIASLRSKERDENVHGVTKPGLVEELALEDVHPSTGGASNGTVPAILDSRVHTTSIEGLKVVCQGCISLFNGKAGNNQAAMKVRNHASV